MGIFFSQIKDKQTILQLSNGEMPFKFSTEKTILYSPVTEDFNNPVKQSPVGWQAYIEGPSNAKQLWKLKLCPFHEILEYHSFLRTHKPQIYSLNSILKELSLFWIFCSNKLKWSSSCSLSKILHRIQNDC